MNHSQDLRGAAGNGNGIPFPSQVPCDPNFNQHNGISEAPFEDSRQVPDCRIQVKIVQNLIERCMKLYMSKDEVLKFLTEKLEIEYSVATLVWQKLEEENAEFFKVYNTRLSLKSQIICFNQLLERQRSLMECEQLENPKTNALAPLLLHPSQIPVNNVSLGYPALQQHPPIPSIVQPTIGYMGNMSTSHAVNGFPEMSNGHTPQMLGNDIAPRSSMMMDAMLPFNPSSRIQPDLALQSMAAKAGQFDFSSPESINNSALTFAPDMPGSEGLPPPLVPDDGTGMYGYLSPFPSAPWDPSLIDPNSDFTAMGGPEFFVDDLPDLGTQTNGDFTKSDKRDK